MEWLELVLEFVKTNFTVIVLAIPVAALAVLSGVTVHAMNRAADRRIKRRAAKGLGKNSADQLRKYLHFMKHAVSGRNGPQRWAVSRSEVAAGETS